MIYIVTLGFNNPTVIDSTLKSFAELTDFTSFTIKRILVDCNYPLPDPITNRQRFVDIAKEHSVDLVRLRENLGQDGNMNFIFRMLVQDYSLANDDVVLFFDPDNYPVKRDYLKAMVLASGASTEIGYVTLWRRHGDWEMRTSHKELEDFMGVRYRRLNCTGGWPCGLFTGRFILASGMEVIPQSHSFYGGTEANIWSALNKANMHGVMLEDFEDAMTKVDVDPLYIQWKVEAIQMRDAPDFYEWMRIKQLLDTTSTDKQ